MQVYETKPVVNRLIPNLLVAILAMCVIEFAYIGVFIAAPIKELKSVVADHSQKIDSITTMLSVRFKPETAQAIDKIYQEKINAITTR